MPKERSHGTVPLDVSDGLVLEVVDDGRGIGGDVRRRQRPQDP
ncbi:hypothetical protein [Geodermatophilus sp. SYSU D00766]